MFSVTPISYLSSLFSLYGINLNTVCTICQQRPHILYATYHPFGEPSEGVSVAGTVRGGTGVLGAQAGGSLSEEGFAWTWGAGFGIGFGGSATATHTIQVIDWSSIYNWITSSFDIDDAAEEKPCN